MLFLVSLIAAALAWLFGWRLFVSSGLPSRRILRADMGSSFPQSAALTSRRYGLTGKPDYLVRVENGLVPVELKSGRSPHSARPYEGHVFQLAGYCLLVEDLYQVPVPYGLIRYDDRTIRVDYTWNIRERLLEVLDEVRSARRRDKYHINHARVG
jgi:CRISPR-associated exonuclease Cas4